MPAGSGDVTARDGSTSARTFVNDPADVVEEMLDGFLMTHAGRVRRLKGASRALDLRELGELLTLDARAVLGELACRREDACLERRPGGGARAHRHPVR